MAQIDAAIALNRFGLGARPGDMPPSDPRGWLLGQFDRFEVRPAALAAVPSSAEIMTGYGAYIADRRPNDTQADEQARVQARRQFVQSARQSYLTSVSARTASALSTETPFVERLTHFWANHFAISVEKQPVRALAGAYEVEAIRPHVLGNFRDMLMAAERHAAMQLYLDQIRSIGPDSPAAKQAAARRPGRMPGLNENLAREILELHTLGARTGYTQGDVTEFARALTGWGTGGVGAGARDAGPGESVFRPGAHEPGPRTIRGRVYAQRGPAQAEAILADLAADPITARHICLKLARHFVADDPPPALVERMGAAYLKSGGHLPDVYRTLVEAPEAWAATAPKFKTPWDWLVSSLRGLGRRDVGQLQPAALLTQLGQAAWTPGSPAGFDDVAASWAAPDALVRRVELAQRFAAVAGNQLDARQLADRLMPGALAPRTRDEISRAESPTAALALLLVSPDFLRR